MSDLPATNRFLKSDNHTTIMLENFCVIGLKMDIDILHHWERPVDYDAYRIVTWDGLEFVISGPQLESFTRNQDRYRHEG